MEVLTQTVTVTLEDTDSAGKLKLSALLHYVQEVSGQHSAKLGFDWDTLAQKGLFWAVLRHRVEITRLPKSGEQLQLRTWPMPTTRTAYPRAVQALDGQGNPLFRVVSLWVLMDQQSRAMILPGKSGVEVPGLLLGCESAAPGSLGPVQAQDTAMWQVSREDLDVNGHVNNAKYLDRVFPELTTDPKALTVCYLSEVRLGQDIRLDYLRQADFWAVDGCRKRTDVPEKTERVFAAKLEF